MHCVSLLVVGLLAMLVTLHCVQGEYVPSQPFKPTRKHLYARSSSGEFTDASSVTKRLVAKPVISARHRDSQRPARLEITADMPAGTPIAGEYIVLYKPGVQDLQAAVSDSHARVAAAAAAASTSGAISTASVASVAVLSSSEAPEGVSSQAVIQAPARMDPQAVREALMASEHVEAVVQNRVVSIAQSGGGKCYPPYYAAGVQGNPTSGISFTWQDCLTSSTKLGLFGERCGTNKDKFRWTGIYAYDPSNNQVVNNCVRLRSAETDATRIANFFGDCGVAPKYFSGLPTTVCQEGKDDPCVSSDRLGEYIVDANRALCSGGSEEATFTGVPCGPDGSLVQWNNLSPRGCQSVDRSSADPRTVADWLGQCGVPPHQIVGLPTRICDKLVAPPPNPPPSNPNPPPPPKDNSPKPPPPSFSGGKLPAVSLRSGEGSNWGVSRIGSYDSSKKTVADVSSAVASTNMRVVVLGTGCDLGHADLNIVEFTDFVDQPGTDWYKRDGNGHGTHVAGIIAAKNNGMGMFGVVPGMPIIALKVLPKSGSGPLDAVYTAYADVVARLQRGEKIVSINLSLSSISDDAEAKAVECNLVKKIQAYGTVVAAAAGNDGEAMDNNLPAACMEAMTVTSLDVYDNPSSFSNYATTGSSKKASMLAAPGSSIYSTYTGGGYVTLSGTSMATPFVAGGAASCFLTGSCKLSSSPDVTPAVTTNYPTMISAAQAYGCSSSKCAPGWGTSGKYYGYMLNTRTWT